MYVMNVLVRHGSERQRRRVSAANRRRGSAPAIDGSDEPTTGTDTTQLKTTAVRRGDRYLINGQKVWISRVQHSDLMLLLARTTPIGEG